MRKLIYFMSLFPMLLWAERSGVFTDKGEAGTIDGSYFGVWQDTFKEGTFLFYYSSGDDLTATGGEGPQDVAPSYATGMRIAGELNPNPFGSVQIVFMGFLNWTRNRGINAPSSNIYVPINEFDVDEWSGIANLYYTYHENLLSTEISYWCHVTPRFRDYFSFSWMAGLRYIWLKDELNILAATAASQQNQLDLREKNRLIGAQIGGSINYRGTERLLWVIDGKFGVYPNFIEEDLFLTDDNNSRVVDDNEYTHLTAAYTFDLGATLIYELEPFYLRASAAWLTLLNIALSPYQISNVRNLTRIDWERDTTLKGVQVGAGIIF